ncbi:histidine kinase N-terminal 7TM domain-containing protein [Natrinema sp. 1APR25-10V2]|uniref:histidine kinase N-terminal 7TM domain-containing protein n=1 Tax=Natrinema sp. 1APR25-10V2 TaxID=2951081 RepID=UPI002874CE22|nr:histidine kinase N-terminal 7TM domain-containing protein [Natrinema sp. 1APR25-10V2]MDS0478466.1 ATP-binding protein [Natrinema sp. 1APR25-10V2]
MAWRYTPHTPALAIATVVGLIVAVIAWRRRGDPAARWAAYCNCSIAAWAFLHLVTVSNTVYEVKLYAFAIALGNIGLLAIVAFGYVLHYTGRREWLTRRRLASLLAVPLSLVGLLLIDGTRELVLFDPHLDSSGSVDRLRYGWGPLWPAFALVFYALDTASLAMLAQKFRRSRNVYRKITFVIFLAVSIPVVGTVVSLSGRSPFPHFVLLPYLVLFTSVMGVLTMTSATFFRLFPLDRLLVPFRSRFGSLVPLARDVVVEEVDNGIVVLDTEGRIVDINSTGKKMIGADHPIGKHIADAARTDFIVTPDLDIDAITESVGELDGSRYEIWVAPADDEYCYEIRFTVIETDGDPAGIVMIIHDITDQKDREEELRARERELERQKSNLQRQARKLEHQNERLDEFASIVSHDLRNPLNVADGYLEMIAAASVADDGDVDHDHVGEARHALYRMEAIIEDALTLAREGQAITETERVSVRDLATDAWSTVDTGDTWLEFDLGTKRAGGSSEMGPEVRDDLFVEADRNRLRRVFENLFRNAVEHSSTQNRTSNHDRDSTEGIDDRTAIDTDGRAVTVTVGRLESGTGFYVADDGPGIPADRRDEVLEQGYSTNEEGTGLGLSIVLNVVNAHGWDLTVSESDRGGAKFEVASVTSVGADSSGDGYRIEK